MRTLMTLLTLGAAGAGYVYLQQTPAAGEPYHPDPTSRPGSDWYRNRFALGPTNRAPAKEFVSRIHEHTRSILDDFVNQHGGHSDAPIDDAFQRLRQVTQSTIGTSELNGSSHSFENGTVPSRIPIQSLEQLQATAFDPAAVEEPSRNRSAVETVSGVSVSQTDEQRLEPSEEKTAEVPTGTTPTQPRHDSRASSETPNPTTSETNEQSSTPQSTTDQTASSESTVVRNLEPDAVPAPQRTVAKTASNRHSKMVPAEWKVVGKTTEGRQMHTMHLGDRGTRTLIIAGLNGQDRAAVRWLELLADDLRCHPELLSNTEFTFFRAGNPDGLTRGTSNNARGIPLNRNFPSRRYRPPQGVPPFAAPASEAETRVILDTLYSFRPRRVVHLSVTPGRSQVLYNRAAKKLATDFETETKIAIQLFDSEQFPGSLEDFSDGTLEAAVLSIQLNSGDDWQQAWAKVQLQALAAVTGQSVDASEATATETFDPERSPIPPAKEPPRKSRGRGYEELPPPPLR